MSTIHPEWHRKAVVSAGGVIHVVLPELAVGSEVEIVVRPMNGAPPDGVPSKGKRPGFGMFRGQIRMSDDFEAPLPDFDEYA